MKQTERLQQELSQLQEAHRHLQRLVRILLIAIVVMFVLGTTLSTIQLIRTNSVASRTKLLNRELHGQDEFLVVSMGEKQARFQVDGNLVIVGRNGSPEWASGTSNAD